MSTFPARIPEADWLVTPASVGALILTQQQEIQALRQENDELRLQLTALAAVLVTLQERIGRSIRNSSNPPSSNGPGFKPPERRQGQWPQARWPAGPPSRDQVRMALSSSCSGSVGERPNSWISCS